MNKELETVFLAFCDSTKKGSTTATDKTIKKICTDAKIYSKKIDTNRVDIEFRKCIGNAKKDANFATFNTFIEKYLAKVYAESIGSDDIDGAINTLKGKIIASSPKTHGATKASVDETTKRLTDVKGYTGAHKERFDPDGKGRGIEGRVDINKKADAGYVGGYKEHDTYDKSH